VRLNKEENSEHDPHENFLENGGGKGTTNVRTTTQYVRNCNYVDLIDIKIGWGQRKGLPGKISYSH